MRRLLPYLPLLPILATTALCGDRAVQSAFGDTDIDAHRGAYEGNEVVAGAELKTAREDAFRFQVDAAPSYQPPGPPDDPWGAYIHEAAARFSMPERWIREVMRQESGGRLRRPNGALTTSWAGAMGLMQIMPGTYDLLRRRYGLGKDPYDPHDNILAGAAYIREMFDRYGAPDFLAAYNAGPLRVEAYLANGTPLPVETERYLARVGPRLGPELPGPQLAAAGPAHARVIAGLTAPTPQVTMRIARAETVPVQTQAIPPIAAPVAPLMVAPVRVAETAPPPVAAPFAVPIVAPPVAEPEGPSRFAVIADLGTSLGAGAWHAVAHGAQTLDANAAQASDSLWRSPVVDPNAMPPSVSSPQIAAATPDVAPAAAPAAPRFAVFAAMTSAGRGMVHAATDRVSMVVDQAAGYAATSARQAPVLMQAAARSPLLAYLHDAEQAAAAPDADLHTNADAAPPGTVLPDAGAPASAPAAPLPAPKPVRVATRGRHKTPLSRVATAPATMVASAAPAAPAPPSQPVFTEWGIELGSYADLEASRKALRAAYAMLGESMSAQPVITPVQQDGRPMYRAQLVGLDPNLAVSACDFIIRHHARCMAIPPGA